MRRSNLLQTTAGSGTLSSEKRISLQQALSSSADRIKVVDLDCADNSVAARDPVIVLECSPKKAPSVEDSL